MGIQGLTGFLENTINFKYHPEGYPSIVKFYEDIPNDVLQKYTHVFFDFHALVITVGKFYTEALNNFMNIVNSIIIKETNRRQNLNTKLSIDNEIILSKYIAYKFLTKIFDNDNNIINNILLNKKDGSKIELKDDISLDDFKIIFTNFSEINGNKEEIFQKLTIKHVQDIISRLSPDILIYIVNDGKPNYAKMIEQLKRRLPQSIQDFVNDNLEANLINLNLISHLNTIKFDMSLVNRDNNFLQDICNKLKDYGTRIKIINDGEENRKDGEGEHIINNLIFEKGKEIIDNNLNKEWIPEKRTLGKKINFLYYSPDGDTVLLSLIAKIKLEEYAMQNNKTSMINIDLIRTENLNFSYYKIKEKLKSQEIKLNSIFDGEIKMIDIKGKYDLIFEKGEFHKFKNINKYGNYIYEENTTTINKVKLQIYYTSIKEFENLLLNDFLLLINHNYTVEPDKGKIYEDNRIKLLKQYIFLFSLLGNDFIPKINSLSISNITYIIQSFNIYFFNNVFNEKFLIVDNMNNIKFDNLYNLLQNLSINKIEPLNVLNNENIFLNDVLDNESKRKRDYKEINEFMDFNKILLLNDNDAVFNLIKYIFDYGYFIHPSNIKEKDLYKQLADNLTNHTKTINKNLGDKQNIIKSENEYFKNLFVVVYKYYQYLNNQNEEDNPFKINSPDVGNHSNRKIPVSEIIKFDANKNDGSAEQYIKGMCYTYKLYFDGDTTNKCWYYPDENPPSITDLVEYIQSKFTNDETEPNGFFNMFIGNQQILTIEDNNEIGDFNSDKTKEQNDVLHNSIDNQKSREANKYYVFSKQDIPRYYNIANLFDCYNVRYANKCPPKANSDFIPVDNEGNIVQILLKQTTDIKQKKKEIEEIAKGNKKLI